MECAQAKGAPTFLPSRRSSESFTSSIIPIMSRGSARATPSAADPLTGRTSINGSSCAGRPTLLATHDRAAIAALGWPVIELEKQ